MNRLIPSLLMLVLLPITLGGCIRVKVHDAERIGLTRCTETEQLHDRFVLYFGRNKADGSVVTEADWQGFLDATVSPQFPDGFSWLASHGQWRDDSGKLWQEPGFQLIVLSKDPATAEVQAVSEAYRQAFAQLAVLQERGKVCVRLDQAPPASE
ncbi:hypothetical protein C7S18_20195 [Ahniella affigens]|uniref:DUF3574 domain-containing protein n=1 Tax=Ahniella affigens TaxID=2021234 RepID=A0A2P1PWX4_9GAMM|nr:DUF3574 domain-containing protein [Ahniella affigens]AVP99348.1 hypothetical protein C7S18_20195 [Ahniella affigens]